MTSSVPILIYPHNNEVPSALVNFMWTPALSPSLTQSQISYLLEVMEEDPATEPIQRIRIPAGQTFYQWSAADVLLRSGVKYYYRVRALDANGNPFGGRDGSGSNMVKWFFINPMDGGLTLADLDRLVRAASDKEPSVHDKISGLKIKRLVEPSQLSDPLLRQWKEGSARVLDVETSGK